VRRILAASVVSAIAFALSLGGAVVVEIGDAAPDCSPAGTASLAFTCQNLKIPVNVDGANLDATFYVPKAASRSRRVPAILMTHGYGGWHRSSGDIAAAQSFAAKGYAVLAYTSRGFGRSEGTVQLQAPEWEVRDARDLITWLATPSNTGNRIIIDNAARKDPRVGMYGASYAGGIQLLTAAYDHPRRLDAIVPLITWNDLRYSLIPNGVIHHAWIDLLYASGKYAGLFGPIGSAPPPVASTEGVPTDQDIQVLSGALANENVDMPLPYSDGTGNSYDYLARRSVAPVARAVKVPTFLIQGQRDTLFTIHESFRTLASISTRPADKKLLIYSAGHGYTALEAESAAIQKRVLAWFARYLKRARTPTGPRIETWRPWAPEGSFGAPPRAARQMPVPLAGPAPVMLTNTVSPTSWSETTNFQSTTSMPSEDAAPGMTSQDWTAQLPRATYVLGSPRLRFTISTVAPEAIVFAKLWDVGPEGRTLIHHLVTPARVRGGVGDFCSGHLAAPFEPGTSAGTTDVCLALQPVVWRIQAGHSLAVTIATSNATHFSSRFPAVYEISNVRLTVPVVPAF
jgi:ABC-2 type transport system ATP-binding protein